MTKVITAAVITTSTILGAQVPVAAAKSHRSCIGWQYQVDHRTPLTTRERRMKKLIHCVFREVGIPQEGSFATIIADRESGLAPWALNPSSGAAGLFQHIQSYWPGRAHGLPKHQFPRWPHSSVWKARANTWAAAIMVKHSGWGAWSTA